jgi:hypothetical protein
MVDYILASLMVGMALTYILELIDLGFVSRASLNKFLTLPLSVGGFYLLGYWDTSLVVAVPSSIFVALYIGKQLNKPAQVITPRLPRI